MQLYCEMDLHGRNALCSLTDANDHYSCLAGHHLTRRKHKKHAPVMNISPM